MSSKSCGTTRRTLSTTIYERGDVVLVEFIFTNQREAKKRPCLVLSAAAYNHDRDELVLAAITSNLERVRYGDTELEHWESAGLRLPSLVAAILQTMKRDLVVRVLGALSDSDLARVEENLVEALGLGQAASRRKAEP